jgi:hypothetical protein
METMENTSEQNVDFTIDQDDLKCLFLHTEKAYQAYTFEKFVEECKQVYIDYRKRNLDNLAKYGEPKSFSQWVNGQVVYLTL